MTAPVVAPPSLLTHLLRALDTLPAHRHHIACADFDKRAGELNRAGITDPDLWRAAVDASVAGAAVSS